MIALSLAEIAAVVGGELHPAAGEGPDLVLAGVVDTDSRMMGADGIFFAKPGAVTDGHLFVGAAQQNGARLAVVERLVDEPISQIVVGDVLDALAALAREVVARVRAAGRLRLVGVTGSNGKTTTKNFLHQILGADGEAIAPIGSYNNEVGAPVTMLRVGEQTQYLISEYGAVAPGDIARLAALAPPDVAVVLMVGSAHAGGLGDLEQTAATKAGLIEQAVPGGTAVLNLDDPRVRQMVPLAQERGLEVVGFGQADAATVRASAVEVSAQGTRAMVHVDDLQLPLRLKVIGIHHIHNALAAIAAARALGVDPAASIARLEQVDIAARWRMEPMGSERIRIYNDAYNASPDSMAAALRTLAQITRPGERAVAVLGSMAELGESAGEEHDRIGLLAVRLNIPRIVIVGAEARRMYLAAVGEGSWDGEAVHLEDADAAYDYLMGELRTGDRVLVKSSNSAGLRLLGDLLGESFS